MITPDPVSPAPEGPRALLSPDRTVVVVARDAKHFRWRGTDGHDYRDQDVADWLPLVPAVSPAPARPRVVCISGSMRFEEQMRLAAVEESVAGHVVVMPHVNMKRPLPLTLPSGHDPKPGLDALHLAKIDLADEVLVVAPGGYVGDSTRREMAHAEDTGTPVRFWQGCTCTTSCPETDNPCPLCAGLDVYEPCPVVGFGCGTGCECCTPEQQAAASTEEKAS